VEVLFEEEVEAVIPFELEVEIEVER